MNFEIDIFQVPYLLEELSELLIQSLFQSFFLYIFLYLTFLICLSYLSPMYIIFLVIVLIMSNNLLTWCFIKVSSEIPKNSQENTYARVSFLIKLQTFVKNILWHRCFPANLAKFLRTAFL